MQHLKPKFKDTPNTMAHYMLNARSFVKHLRSCPPEGCRLTPRAAGIVVAVFDGLIKTNKKNVSERQHNVKVMNRELLHTPAQVKQAVLKSKEEIPGLLGKSVLHLTFILILTGLWRKDCPLGLSFLHVTYSTTTHVASCASVYS